MKRALVILSLLACAACVRGEQVVAACEDAVAARNALPCVADDDVQNPAGECGVLNDEREAQAANPEAPLPVVNCARDEACTNNELLSFYECRADNALCDENDEPKFADFCDDLIP